MDELVRWLGEQLDEDERIAREAEGDSVFDGTGIVVQRNRARGFPDRTAVLSSPVATHIARHDPARVLREIDAKRRLLAIHRPYVPEPDQACLGCAGGIMFTSCPVVRLLALPYADRPGYRDDWRP
ncbi:DUF6221 family protein [Streptomyces sp. NPDC001296]